MFLTCRSAWTAALALLVLTGCGTGEAFDQSGPLSAEAGSSYTGIDAEVNAVIGFGSNVMTNNGDKDAVLEVVGLAAESEDLAVSQAESAPVIETWAVDYTQGGEQLLVDDWPTDRPIGALEPLNGYVVKPGATVEFVIVIKLKQETKLQWDGIVVKYMYGGLPHVETTTHGLVVCSPSSHGTCAADKG